MVRAQSGRDKRRWVEDGLSNNAFLLFTTPPSTNFKLYDMSSAAARKQQLEAARAERERAAREAEEKEAAELAEIERLEREEEEERRRVEEERRKREEEARAAQAAKEAAARERVHQQMLLVEQVRLQREARENEQWEQNAAAGPSGAVDRSEFTERVEAEICWRCRHNGRTCING